MNRFTFLLCMCLGMTLAGGSLFAYAAHAAQATEATEATAKRLTLPKPDTEGGKTLLQALALRKTTRNFSDKPVAEQDLSNLLWAAWGVTHDGKRTVPTANNKQEAALYVALESGVWQYDGQKHELVLALAEDARSKLGGAPVILLYAAPEKDHYAGMHVGSMYQNVGLYCASAGLANVVKAQKADALNGVLPLPDGYKVFILQLVGMPR